MGDLYSLEMARGDARGETRIINRRGKIPDEDVYPDQAAWSKRCRNRERKFSATKHGAFDQVSRLWIWASTGPLLTKSVKPATTASLSLHKLCAKRDSSAMWLASTACNHASNS